VPRTTVVFMPGTDNYDDDMTVGAWLAEKFGFVSKWAIMPDYHDSRGRNLVLVDYAAEEMADKALQAVWVRADPSRPEGYMASGMSGRTPDNGVWHIVRPCPLFYCQLVQPTEYARQQEEAQDAEEAAAYRDLEWGAHDRMSRQEARTIFGEKTRRDVLIKVFANISGREIDRCCENLARDLEMHPVGVPRVICRSPNFVMAVCTFRNVILERLAFLSKTMHMGHQVAISLDQPKKKKNEQAD